MKERVKNTKNLEKIDKTRMIESGGRMNKAEMTEIDALIRVIKIVN